MKKVFVIFICLVVIFSFSACTNEVKFTETEDKTIVTIDGTEYTFVGYEGRVCCFGEIPQEDLVCKWYSPPLL